VVAELLLTKYLLQIELAHGGYAAVHRVALNATPSSVIFAAPGEVLVDR